MSKYKEEIDEAEERELAAKNELLDAESRVEKTQGEVEGLRRRLVLLREDLTKTKERLAVNKEKLDHVEGRYGDDDEMRQEFEATEMERDDQLILLEEECASAKKLSNEAHTVMVESERKMVVLENDLQRTIERLAVGKERVDALEARINSAGSEIQSLEDRDNEAADREQLSEEKTKFLEDQVREAEENSEMRGREVGKLERVATDYLNEINIWKRKTGAVNDEMQSIEDMADEQLDEHDHSRHSKAAQRRDEPEREPEPEPEPEPEHESESEPEPEHDVEPEPEPVSEEEADED